MIDFPDNNEMLVEGFFVVAEKAGAALEKQQEQITKKWLKAMINDMELDSLQSFPTEMLISSIPQFISCIANSINQPVPPLFDNVAFNDLAAIMATMRKDKPDAIKVFDDYAVLKHLFFEAASMDLRSSDVGALQVFQRLDVGFMNFFRIGMEAYMKRHNQELQQMANTDALTGLFNVRYFHQQLHKNLEMFNRYSVPFSILMLDIDNLKQLNDLRGHEIGDCAITRLADVLLKEKRDVDIAFRCGGDEFFQILPGTEISDAHVAANRVIKKLKGAKLGDAGHAMTSVSVGLVSCPQDGTEADTLRSKVDQALYLAKRAGGGVASRYR